MSRRFVNDICAKIAATYFKSGDQVKIEDICFGLNDKDVYTVGPENKDHYLPIADKNGKLLGYWLANRFKKEE